jgi:hypothetical protein
VGGGATVELDLAPGEKRTVERQLYGKVSVRVGVTRVLRIDGRPVTYGETLELAPGPHKAELQGEAPSFIHVPTRACELRDTPELACYEAR